MAFDPTLPFEVVEEPEKRKEGFDPSAPYEVENVSTSDERRAPSLFFRRQDQQVTELNPDGSVPEGEFDPTKPFDVEQAPQPRAAQEGGGYGTIAARSVPLATAQMLTGLERMTDAAVYDPSQSRFRQQFGVLDTPQQLRETIPVRPDVEQSLGGQFIEGLGQVVVGAGLGIATGGLGNVSMALAGAGQLFEEGYQDQIRSGADENTAKQNAFKYTASSLPLEFLGDKVVVEGLFRGLPDGLIDRGMTVMDAVKRVVAYGAIGSQVDGGTEAAQQVLLNTLSVDPNRKLSDGVLDSYLVGSLVGGTASTATSAVGYGRAVADPENQARVLQTRVENQARQAAAQPDALARAANIPSSARLENFNVTSRDDGKNQTKATYRDEDGKRFTVTVQEDQSKVDTQYLALPEPRQLPTGEGTPVPVGTQVVPRMDRETRQIVSEEQPVTGRVITPPQQLQAGEEARLNVIDPSNGQADFLVGTVTEDGQGVRISRIPESLLGLSQQATDATTATQTPRRMPKVGDVVPLSVAERDFRSYGFRPEGAWYSNMAYRPEPAAQTEPFTAPAPTEPSIPQTQANQQTLSAAQRSLVPPAPSRQAAQRVRAPLPESYIKASVRQVTPSLKQEAARGGNTLINSLRRVAPRGAAELEVISGPAPEGTPSGAVGSYNPRRALVWLSDKIASFPQQVKEWTHELGHVHWDTLPTPVKRAVATLRAAEVSRRTGPLFNEKGGLRDGISPRVLSGELQADSIAPWDTLGLREYYSERLMAENAAWSLRRSNANSTFGRISEGVRSFIERVGSSLGKGDAVTNSFRAWADLGPRYGIREGGTERVESMREATSGPSQVLTDEGDDADVRALVLPRDVLLGGMGINSETTAIESLKAAVAFYDANVKNGHKPRKDELAARELAQAIIDANPRSLYSEKVVGRFTTGKWRNRAFRSSRHFINYPAGGAKFTTVVHETIHSLTADKLDFLGNPLTVIPPNTRRDITLSKSEYIENMAAYEVWSEADPKIVRIIKLYKSAVEQLGVDKFYLGNFKTTQEMPKTGILIDVSFGDVIKVVPVYYVPKDSPLALGQDVEVAANNEFARLSYVPSNARYNPAAVNKVRALDQRPRPDGRVFARPLMRSGAHRPVAYIRKSEIPDGVDPYDHIKSLLGYADKKLIPMQSDNPRLQEDGSIKSGGRGEVMILIDESRNFIKQKTEKPLINADPDITTKRGGDYALGNLDEFLAQSFSDAETQNAFKKLKGDGQKRSLWQSLVDAIRNILGIKTENSLLESIMDAAYDLAGIGREQAASFVDVSDENVSERRLDRQSLARGPPESQFSMRGAYSVTEDSPRAQKWADLGQKIKENRGGFTIDPDTLELQSGGYFTAISLDTEFRVDISQSDRKVGQDVRDYLIRTRQLIRENPQAFLGGWVDEDTKELVLDISYRTDNPQDALDLARRGGQKAIFDANTFRTIRTDVGLRFMRQRGMEVTGSPQTESLAQRNMAVAGAPRLAGEIRSKPRYRPSSFKDILPYIDAREAGTMKFRADTQARIEEIFNAAPQDIDYEVASRMGMIKKGWYARAAKILNQIFGDDADLFIGVLAATSPRQTVRENLDMALRVWDVWQKAGRPSDYQTIIDNIARPIAALESRYLNVARHLTAKDMSEDSRKVKSFYDNSGGNLYSVTLDTWMALFGGVDQAIFGTKSGYAAHAAKVRRVAERMGLQPAEVQETVWSFFKTLVDSSTGGVTPKELIFDLTDTDVYSTPEFYDLALQDPEIRQQLEQHAGAGLLARIDNEQLSRGGETPLGIPVSSLAGRDSQRVLERIAGRAVEARTRLAKAEGEVADPFSIRGSGQTSANLGELEALVPSNYTPAVENQIAGRTEAAMTPAGYVMPEPSKNEFVLKTRRLVFDMNADFRDFLDRMRREGRTVAESSDYYTVEQNMHGIQGAMMEELFSQQDAIIEKIRKDKLNIDEVGEYLLAKHAPERNAYLKKTKNRDNGSGISDQEAAQILQRLAPNRAKFEEISRMVQDLNRNKLAFLEKSGMISQESRSSLQAVYPNYVSLAQDEDVVLGPALREATGRFTKPSQMLAFTFMGQQRAVVLGNKNLSLLALNRMVKDFPDNGLIEPLAEFRGDETPISDNVIKFRENGEIKYLRILKPELENTFHLKRGLTDLFLLDPVGRATRFIASMATTYNPAFPIPNIFRDTQTGLFNLASTELAKQQKAYLSKIPTAIRAIWVAENKATKRGEPVNVSPKIKRMMDYYAEFNRAGGRMVFMGLRDAEYYAKRINRMVSGNLATRVPRMLVGGYIELMDHANASLENASRLSAYVTAREMGLSEQRSANIARNLTTNFTKKGQAKFLNKMYAFFNASIQGNARMLESLRTPQGKATAAAFVLAGIVWSMVSRALDDEDEKTGVKDMDKLPEYVKSVNLLAAFPYSANYLKMPLAYGWNVFYYLGVKIADAMPKDFGGKGESPLSAGLSWVGSVVNAFNPTGGGEDLITSIYPTVLQPFTEILVNKDFAGRPIYPQDVSFDPNQTPYAFRHWANVNPLTKFTSEGIARLTGGTEARPSGAERLLGKFGADRLLSPESLDHVFNAVFSGPYGLITQLLSTGVGLSVGKEVDPNKIPIFRRFYGEVGPSNDAMMYSQARGSVFMAFDDLQIAQKNRDGKQVQYVKENYAPELSVVQSFRKADTYLKDINTELKAARSRGDQAATEKLEKQRNDIHRQVLGMYLNEVKRFDAGKL